MTASESRKGSRLTPLIIGLAAFAGGLWLFLDSQNVGIPPFKELWPTLLFLASAAALADLLFLSRRPSSAGWSVAYLGFGVLGLALTLGYTNWRKILDWLPSFPTIFGLSMVVTWLVDGRRNHNLMVSGVVLIGLGVLGFAARFDFLQRLLPSAQVLWAVLLLVGGGLLVWRAVSQSRD